MEISKSASKIVFISLTTTACIGFLIGKLPVDQFMILAIAASSFYFSNKGEAGNVPYAGKQLNQKFIYLRDNFSVTIR